MIVFHAHYGGAPDFNMGFDEWLLHTVIEQPEQVHIRLYTWSEGAITIGRNQRLDSAVDLHRVGETPVIRRVTGGRALYHDLSEVTYCLVWDTESSPSPVLRRPGVGSLNSVSVGLVSFLRGLGRPAEIVRASSGRNARPDFFHKAPCFASRARWEIISADRKIVASAARRHKTAVLQHGAIKLNGTATHPALNPESSSTQTLRRIDPEAFGRLAADFERQMCDHLGLASMSMRPSEAISANNHELQLRVDYVKKNRLGQRDIFERRLREGSLYHGGAEACRQKRA